MHLINPFQFEGVVTGSDFCDRKDDIAMLNEYINSGNNVIISMKRRVGKTSLIKELFKNHLDKRVLSGYIDIYSATSVKDIYDAFKDGVQEAVGNALRLKIAKERIAAAFEGANIKLSLGSDFGIDIEFAGTDYSALISRMLVSLQQLAVENHLKVALAIDEFQRIGHFEEREKLEGDIRTVMQGASQITFILSGSNQTMLDSMFEAGRPLYRQGAHYALQPIQESVFFKWAKKRFTHKEVNLSKEAFSAIYTFANGEAKIVQHICFMLFFRAEPLSMVIENDVCKAVEYIYRNNSEIAALFGAMSMNEQRMMKVIAFSEGHNVTVSPYLKEVGMKTGSVSGVLKKLLEEYKVIKDDDGRYEMVDAELKLWILVQKKRHCGGSAER